MWVAPWILKPYLFLYLPLCNVFPSVGCRICSGRNVETMNEPLYPYSLHDGTAIFRSLDLVA